LEALPCLLSLCDYILFAYLTGMRKGEVSSLTWKNLEGDTLRLPGKNSKNGEGRVIPLEGELRELIERRKAARQIGTNGAIQLSELIFRREGRPVYEFRKSWRTAL
jgi:integrase